VKFPCDIELLKSIRYFQSDSKIKGGGWFRQIVGLSNCWDLSFSMEETNCVKLYNGREKSALFVRRNIVDSELFNIMLLRQRKSF